MKTLIFPCQVPLILTPAELSAAIHNKLAVWQVQSAHPEDRKPVHFQLSELLEYDYGRRRGYLIANYGYSEPLDNAYTMSCQHHDLPNITIWYRKHHQVTTIRTERWSRTFTPQTEQHIRTHLTARQKDRETMTFDIRPGYIEVIDRSTQLNREYAVYFRRLSRTTSNTTRRPGFCRPSVFPRGTHPHPTRPWYTRILPSTATPYRERQFHRGTHVHIGAQSAEQLRAAQAYALIEQFLMMLEFDPSQTARKARIQTHLHDVTTALRQLDRWLTNAESNRDKDQQILKRLQRQQTTTLQLSDALHTAIRLTRTPQGTKYLAIRPDIMKHEAWPLQHRLLALRHVTDEITLSPQHPTLRLSSQTILSSTD